MPHDPVPEAVGGYAELLARPDIDAVYIPLPTGLRKEWVLAAAAAGKHVLCEKPCGVDANEVREITEACDKAGVQFMDGVMFMHNDRLAALRHELDAGTIGTIRRIATQFSFLAPDEFFSDNIRLDPGLEPLGSLGDLVLGGKPDPHWPEISLKTQVVLDACLRSAQDGGREVVL